ncbi:MAG: thioredoxin domain-containing protein [Chloroflexota bacterium]
MVIYPSLKPVGEIVGITPQADPSAPGRVLGEAEAPVLIELYEDFQCPACGAFTRSIKPLLVQNFVATGQTRLAFRHFAFIGPESLRAAEASMCADEQGRFWDYHDLLFAN